MSSSTMSTASSLAALAFVAALSGAEGMHRTGARTSAFVQPLSSHVVPPRAAVTAVDMSVLDAVGSAPTSALVAADGDMFRLALAGGVGIMVFSIANAFLVGAVARGNWDVFEEEAASWVKDKPGMEELRAKMLSDEDCVDDDESVPVTAKAKEDA
mmetsp:Transcript_17035/g.41955  ORF Transcript_17035/g.41955 Transcript_17035/m.41955 type:complete len:156 (-) Transcript_17035:606-1073(-)